MSPVRPAIAIATLFAVGFGAGYGFRALTEPGRERKPLDLPARDARPPSARGSSVAAPARREGTRGAEGPQARWLEGLASAFRGEPGDGPWAGRPRSEVIDGFHRALESADHRALKQAAEALGPLSEEEVDRFAGWMAETRDRDAARVLAFTLVRHGGAAGLAAVASLASRGDLPLDLRGAAIDALADAPPEGRPAARRALADVLAAGLPEKLEFHAAHAFGRTCEEGGAVAGLAGLLEAPGVRARPVLHAMRDFARAEDMPLLRSLLPGASGREEQEILLRALGSAAGPEGGALLLGLLDAPSEGLRREAVAAALEEFATRDDLPAMWERLGSEGDRAVQASLARTIARAGGAEEVGRLLEAAGAPGSTVSLDAVAQALAKTAGAESLPLLVGALGDVRTWEAAEPLASAILRLSGTEGLESLLSAAQAGGGEERRRAIIQAIEDFGDPAAVERLGALLAAETDHGVAFHLAKAMLRLDPDLGAAGLAERLAAFPDGDQRAALANVLEREGDARLIPALTRALETESWGRAQWHLARALASYGAEGVGAVEGFVRRDPDPQRRAEVLRAMETVAPDAALGLARGLLGEGAPELRRAAVEVLAAHGGEGARDELLGALARETDKKTRATIERALAGKGRSSE